MLLPMFIDIMNGVHNKVRPSQEIPWEGLCTVLIIISIILLIL